MWIMDAPFGKDGVPRMGTSGASVRRVVVMEASEFKRMLAENPSLADVPFRVGEFSDEPEVKEHKG
jgi:hypothetical protein